MPSLHAAFPVLRALYLRKTFGRWGLLMLGYAAIVWFAVVYMAERWLIDVALGVVLTVLAYALVEGVTAAWAARARWRAATEAVAAAMSAWTHKAGLGQ
jgi:PAP2 superfamily